MGGGGGKGYFQIIFIEQENFVLDCWFQGNTNLFLTISIDKLRYVTSVIDHLKHLHMFEEMSGLDTKKSTLLT